MNRGQQRLESRPVERLVDPIQKPTPFPIPAHQRIHERRLGQVTARHRRIILSGLTAENQNSPTSAKLSYSMDSDFHKENAGQNCPTGAFHRTGATAIEPRWQLWRATLRQIA